MSADRILLRQLNYEDGLVGAIVELHIESEPKPVMRFYPEGIIPGEKFPERQKVTAILHAVAQLSYLKESENGLKENVPSIEQRLKNLIERLQCGEIVEIPDVIASSYLRNPQSFLTLTPARLAPHW